MLTLYFAPGSSSFAPHIALHEIGAPFEARRLSIPDKETRTPDYLALNPAGKVPTLLIDGRVLTEVAAILFYLARRFPDAKLLPPDNDIEAQAQVISWMSYVASGLHPVWSKGLDLAMPAFEVADNRLGDNEWAIGNYSIADIHLFRLYWRLAGASDLPAGSLQNLKRHHDQMLQRPAIIRTLEAEAP
ncbi:MAG: glutathione S-transferase family protein [Hyphomicrobiaceae bacterium]